MNQSYELLNKNKQLRDALQIAKDIIIYFGGERPDRWLPVESAKEWEKVERALTDNPPVAKVTDPLEQEILDGIKRLQEREFENSKLPP